jgi:hypothetical protein
LDVYAWEVLRRSQKKQRTNRLPFIDGGEGGGHLVVLPFQVIIRQFVMQLSASSPHYYSLVRLCHSPTNSTYSAAPPLSAARFYHTSSYSANSILNDCTWNGKITLSDFGL